MKAVAFGTTAFLSGVVCGAIGMMTWASVSVYRENKQASNRRTCSR